MDNQQQSLSLNDGQIIGPEHHKFRLKGTATPHPLGEFWQAEDMSTAVPTPVSLIVLSTNLTKHKEFLSAFKQQIILAKNLRHKHLVSVYGYFIQRGDILFFACEALDGLTLHTLIKTKKINKLKENQIRGLLSQIATAADLYINKVRKPHASLAPDIIYINRQGGVKLLPISPRILLQQTNFKLDPSFQFPAYQAPEAFHPNLLPSASDIYSVGCIAYAALSASPPFRLDDDEAMHVRKELKQPTSLNKVQWGSLQQALATAPEQRQKNATELVNALFTENQPAINTPEELSETPKTSSIDIIEVKTSKTISPLWSRILIASTLFITGIAVGFFSGLYLSQQQQAITNQQLGAWKEQAEIWKTTADDQTKTIRRLEEKITEKNATSLETTAPLPREQVALQENFNIFQDALQDGSYGPQMVSLPAGQFKMGDLNNQGDDNEKPIQTIIFTHPFALSRYEVTFEEYDHYADVTGKKRPNDEGWGRGSQPVINVSWQNANAYTKWLAAKTGQPYRLPSEAEWEYAARSGTSTAFWWGNDISTERAVCDECGSDWDGKQPATVGSMPANPWGLHDLNGNVDEWVQDCYSDTYTGHPTDGSARVENNCTYRSMRGGSWFDIGRVIRSASRYRHSPDASRNTWGFRVALDLEK